MAGLSQRFTRAGYVLPKYMLPLAGSTVFAEAMGSFSALYDQEQFLIICRDVMRTRDFVLDECARLGIPNANIRVIVLDAPTAGQAQTVARGLEQADHDPGAPLTIFNIDTFRPGFDYPHQFDVPATDGYLEVFRGDGEQWSFVRPSDDAAHRAVEVTEKVRISDLCCTGLYHFTRTDLFTKLFAEIHGQDPGGLQGGEFYVAPLYNMAISRGLDIRYAVVPREDVVFCGTPEEYESLLAPGAP